MRRQTTIAHEGGGLAEDRCAVRAGPANSSWRPASVPPDTALLTVHGSDGSVRTYAARFGSCSQVVAGTGSAATAGGQLLADIKRLVPNSGL